MCIARITLANGVSAACHECWQCRERAVNDWVGRCIAERKTSVAAHSVSLTYGRDRRVGSPDHERAVILTYSDVQKFLKLFRRHGFPVRYLVAGEFGGKKGRAHWHILLFWQKRVPPGIELGKSMWNLPRYDEETGEQAKDDKGNDAYWWPHGFSFWEELHAGSARYAVKYLQKDMGDELRQGHMSVSKKPPLGAKYFRLLAERYVEQGLSPRTLEYAFPEVKRRKGKRAGQVVPFMLGGRSAELFLDHFVEAWAAKRPGVPRPPSELVERYLEFGGVIGDQTVDRVSREASWERVAARDFANRIRELELEAARRVVRKRWKLETELDVLIRMVVQGDLNGEEFEQERRRYIVEDGQRRRAKLRSEGRCEYCAAKPGQEHHPHCERPAA